MAWLDVLQRHGVRAHLIEVADPAEETFPYSGRTEFSDPETGEKLTAGRAETVSADYRNAYLARRHELAARCKRLGWSYTVNHTDRLASEALVSRAFRAVGRRLFGRGAARMSWLPLSFGFPGDPVRPDRAAGDLVAAAADAAEAADRGLPAAEDTGARAQEGRDAAPEPVVADAAAPADGGAHRAGARRADLQSARGAAVRAARRWRW